MNKPIFSNQKTLLIIMLVCIIPVALSLGVNIEKDTPASTSINSSEYWLTNLGPLNGVNATQFDNIAEALNIDEVWLSSFVDAISSTLFCALTGCNMTGNINMGGNDLTNVNIINAVNGTFTGHLEIQTINGTNATFQNVNITSNNTLTIGGVSLSTSETFEGKRVLSIFDNETGEDVFVNAFAYLGSGFFLTNISFENGTVFASAFNGSQFSGGNFTGDNFTGLNFFGGNFFGDEYTLGGETINNWSDVNYTVSNGTVFFTTPAFSGSSSFLLPDIFHFEIAQIIVEPSTTSGNYRFAMYETGSGETIDADLITHKNTWNIFKSYPIDNQVSLNFTSVSPVKSFDVQIKYFTNVAN